MSFLIYFIGPLLLGLLAQGLVKSSYSKWAQVPNPLGLTGAEVAQRILQREGITGVQIRPVAGELTDHYDPRNRTVNLSEGIYAGRSVSASAIAAHEVGHAIQHAKGYLPLRFRSSLFPAVQFTSSIWMLVLFAGLILGSLQLVAIAVALYSVAVLFHVVTLPVEFDASRRAHKRLADLGMADRQGVRSVLTAAAMTYVAGAIASVAMLLYYLQMMRR